jgi:hypothetical protein
VLIATLGAMQQVGLPKLAGNREHMPPRRRAPWAGRGQRRPHEMRRSS